MSDILRVSASPGGSKPGLQTITQNAKRKTLDLRRKALARAAIVFVATLILALPTTGSAAARGQVEGTVTDPSGASVAEARVALVRAAGIVLRTRTDGNGRFVFSDVAEGDYSLIVEAQGLSQREKTTVTVSPGATARSVVKLEMAAISDRLVVTATRTETPSSELAGSVSVISGDELQRSNQSLGSEALRSTPGLAVVQTGGRGGVTSVFVRGGESDYN